MARRWGTGPSLPTVTGSYLEAWLGSPSARAISLSMPLEQGTRPFAGDRVETYFENLLPESIAIRKRIAQKFGTSASTFDLLAHIGRDCVGAVQLLPLDVEPTGVRRIDAEPLTDGQVEALLDATISNAPLGLGDEEGLRISIAGAQEKTALLQHEGRWCRPLGATPTTHILKLPMGEVGHVRADFSTSVENEWLCAQIAREFGFAVAECEILRFGHHKVLSVARFDRVLLEGWWARRPQEDFCQALGVPAERKYEEHGGPGMADILRVLRGSDGPKEDRPDSSRHNCCSGFSRHPTGMPRTSASSCCRAAGSDSLRSTTSCPPGPSSARARASSRGRR